MERVGPFHERFAVANNVFKSFKVMTSAAESFAPRFAGTRAPRRIRPTVFLRVHRRSQSWCTWEHPPERNHRKKPRFDLRDIFFSSYRISEPSQFCRPPSNLFATALARIDRFPVPPLCLKFR